MSAKAAAKVESNFSYDAVPYESFTYPQTHPSHMAMVGSLFGVRVPDIATARILEIGCAGGGNLLPVAFNYPKSKCLGFDLSQAQIDQANAQKKEMGLTNITFIQQDILDFDLKKHKGAFDYIICHGIYSWVPEAVSDQILKLCRACLSDTGLAIISYNALPGWNAVQALREMMLFHAGRFTNPADKVAEARKLLNFLAESAPDSRGYKALIEEERNLLQKLNDSYLFHDHLEGVNRQFYLHQFNESLVKNDLSYVGDSALTSMYVENLPAKALETLRAVNDVILQEQYMDFVTNRRFRTSIVTRKENTLNRNLRNEQILDYCLSAAMRPESENPDLEKPVSFVRTVGGGSFTTNAPEATAFFMELVACGIRPTATKDIIARAQKRMGLESDAAIREVALQHGLALALRGFITLHMDCPEFVESVSERPIAWPMARYQAARPGCKAVTNVLGTMIPIDSIAAMAIPMMDGKNTVDDIARAITEIAATGKITVSDGNTPISDKAVIQSKLRESVVEIAPKMARNALLIQ